MAKGICCWNIMITAYADKYIKKPDDNRMNTQSDHGSHDERSPFYLVKHGEEDQDILVFR